jgi:hypothetical protein
LRAFARAGAEAVAEVGGLIPRHDVAVGRARIYACPPARWLRNYSARGAAAR